VFADEGPLEGTEGSCCGGLLTLRFGAKQHDDPPDNSRRCNLGGIGMDVQANSQGLQELRVRY
jgi:hypothetical protein